MSEAVVMQMRVPANLFDWLESQARIGGFPSAADYAAMLLEKVAFVMQQADQSTNEYALTDEEELIASRLRALGYIE